MIKMRHGIESKNVGQIMNVNPDGNCGYQAFIEACNYSTRIQS